MSYIPPTARLEREDRQLRAVSLLASGVIGLLFMLLVAWPMQAAIELEQDRMQRLQGVRNSESAIEAHHIRLQSQLETLRGQIATAASRIPAEAREDEFLTLLSRTAQETGVQVQDFRPLGIIQNLRHDQMQVRLSGQADYAALCRFLDAVRVSPRMCRVTQMELSVVDAQRQRCSIDMTIEIFFNDRSTSTPQGGEQRVARRSSVRAASASPTSL